MIPATLMILTTPPQTAQPPTQTLRKQEITGECELNGFPVSFLADTGSSRTIVNKNVLNLNNNEYGPLRNFKHNIITAEGHRAQIIGVKKCKIRIGNWTTIIDVLISNNLIKNCIIGMDILSICPSTKKSIQNLQSIINVCTHQTRAAKFQRESLKNFESQRQRHYYKGRYKRNVINDKEPQTYSRASLTTQTNEEKFRFATPQSLTKRINKYETRKSNNLESVRKENLDSISNDKVLSEKKLKQNRYDTKKIVVFPKRKNIDKTCIDKSSNDLDNDNELKDVTVLAINILNNDKRSCFKTANTNKLTNDT